MIELQDIITTKRELLSRETYSRNSINYSEDMSADQKDQYIQYLAGQNQELRLTSDAMKLVLKDFMANLKGFEDQMAAMQSKHSDLANRLSARPSRFRKDLLLQIRNVLVIGVKRYTLKLKTVVLIGKRRKMIMMVPMIRFVRIRSVMIGSKR